jgi:hypothetical protein
MPAFTFEKISPPVRRGSTAPIEKKPRGFMVQMLARFVQMRIRRHAKSEKSVAAGHHEK